MGFIGLTEYSDCGFGLESRLWNLISFLEVNFKLLLDRLCSDNMVLGLVKPVWGLPGKERVSKELYS